MSAEIAGTDPRRACLPPTCRRWDGRTFAPVAREEADIVDAPVLFYLRNRHRHQYVNFGYSWFSLRPQRYLSAEVDTIEARLPLLFDAFDGGLLLEKSRWPELEGWLGLFHDRTEYFR